VFSRLARLIPSFPFVFLQNDLYSEWRPFYIDYNLLKRELKVIISLSDPLLHPGLPSPQGSYHVP
jgi:hypothetical protein